MSEGTVVVYSSPEAEPLFAHDQPRWTMWLVPSPT